MENNTSEQKIVFTLNESLNLFEFLESKEFFFNGPRPADLMKNYHFKEFYFKLYKQVMKANISPGNNKKVTVKINEIERYVISIILNNFDLNPVLTCVESNIINGLVKLN